MMRPPDRPALVVDLRRAALEEDRRALAEGRTGAGSPPDEPLGEDEAVDLIAVLHDGSDAPLLLPIAPTRDRAWLDDIARLLRFAVLRGERIPAVATRYGDARERRMTFARELPTWAYEGVRDPALARAPLAIRRVLEPPGRHRPDRR